MSIEITKHAPYIDRTSEPFNTIIMYSHRAVFVGAYTIISLHSVQIGVSSTGPKGSWWDSDWYGAGAPRITCPPGSTWWQPTGILGRWRGSGVRRPSSGSSGGASSGTGVWVPWWTLVGPGFLDLEARGSGLAVLALLAVE